MNSFKRVRAFQIELEFGSVGFWEEGKTEVPGEKPLAARERTNFYYYFLNDSEFCFLVQIRAFAVIKLFRIAKF